MQLVRRSRAPVSDRLIDWVSVCSQSKQALIASLPSQNPRLYLLVGVVADFDPIRCLDQRKDGLILSEGQEAVHDVVLSVTQLRMDLFVGVVVDIRSPEVLA